MEQNLSEFNDYESNYFKIEHKNQNIDLLPEFKKWKENAEKYTYKENERRGELRKTDINNLLYCKLLTISFCNNCNCYTICSFNFFYSKVQCSKCNIFFLYWM